MPSSVQLNWPSTLVEMLADVEAGFETRIVARLWGAVGIEQATKRESSRIM